ncbi:MAG TPA: hypothetical protein VKU83_12460 [Puia sp.]|nr:hypothetical protein [Puia sp.]
MKIIQTILTSAYFSEAPPVLIDIGASGEINAKWRSIAPYSVCLAFDADDREFHITEQANQTYKRLITFNRIVTSAAAKEADFYLTASPFCSSLLSPATDKLKPWVFSELFTVERVAKLPTITIEESLKQVKIDYIDWFKTDTQGTDLRLFTSLPAALQDGILAAEFEPGIIDAYMGEDKLYSVMQEMHRRAFWLSTMDVKGVQRLRSDQAAGVSPFVASKMLRKSPGWAEVTYLKQPAALTSRQLLLLYVFALLERQYGFALEITDVAMRQSPDALFRDCQTAAKEQLTKERRRTPLVFFKRKINKLLSRIHD